MPKPPPKPRACSSCGSYNLRSVNGPEGSTVTACDNCGVIQDFDDSELARDRTAESIADEPAVVELNYEVPPHQRDSDTSVAAAHSVAHFFPTTKERVRKYIEEHGPSTDKEIQIGLHFETITSEECARRTLVTDGVLKDSGLRRKNPSGRQAVVWEFGFDPRATNKKCADRVVELEQAIRKVCKMCRQRLPDLTSSDVLEILDGV